MRLQNPRYDSRPLWNDGIIEDLEKLAEWCDEHSNIVSRRIRQIAAARLEDLEEDFWKKGPNAIPFSDGHVDEYKWTKLYGIFQKELGAGGGRSIDALPSTRVGLLEVLQLISKLPARQTKQTDQTYRPSETLRNGAESMHTLEESGTSRSIKGHSEEPKELKTSSLRKINKACLRHLRVEAFEGLTMESVSCLSPFSPESNVIASLGTSYDDTSMPSVSTLQTALIAIKKESDDDDNSGYDKSTNASLANLISVGTSGGDGLAVRSWVTDAEQQVRSAIPPSMQYLQKRWASRKGPCLRRAARLSSHDLSKHRALVLSSCGLVRERALWSLQRPVQGESKASRGRTTVNLMAHMERIATRFSSRSMFPATSVATETTCSSAPTASSASVQQVPKIRVVRWDSSEHT